MWLELKRDYSKTGYQWFLFLSWNLYFQTGVGYPIGCLKVHSILAQLRSCTSFVLVCQRLEKRTFCRPVQFPKPGNLVGEHVVLHNPSVFLLIAFDDGKCLSYQHGRSRDWSPRFLFDVTFTFTSISM